MVTLDRQDIISTNKSLRLIKNELEHLLEKGVVSDDTFDSIMRSLPAESSISSAGTPAANRSSVASPPVGAMANLGLGGANRHQNPSPNPAAAPAYQPPVGPPSLPVRNNSNNGAPPPPPPPPPSKPVIAHTRALYKYTAADERDLSFERDDRILIHEYMNDDWWMGQNQRTGAEGIFPKNYVEVDHSAGGGGGGYVDEKAAPYGGPPQPIYHNPNAAPGYPGPPAQQNPYNANVPPMAVADGGSGAQGGSGGKTGEYGKKFGKKLGNAAIFGAGASIGSNIVNSIF
ncbi:SH3 domain-containing protein [Xylariales sp. PMI_506]|nr:SH3 domain-containing protein [Xylariales sp. PMI_506]